MKKLRNTITLLLCLLLTVGSVLSAFGAEAKQTELTEFFGDACFSDASVNRLLAVFPRMCAVLDHTSQAFSACLAGGERTQTYSSGGLTARFDVDVACDGRRDTDGFDVFFSKLGQNVYPGTLGAYLQTKGYPEIGAALISAGRSWSAFVEDDGTSAFSFDWGVDAGQTAEERYARFIRAAGDLFDAAPVLFDAILGNEAGTLAFSNVPFFCAVITNVEIRIGKLCLVSMRDGMTMTSVSGELTFSPMRVYETLLLPVYRLLGIGRVLPLNLGPYTRNMTGAKKAETVFRPLFELTRAVRTAPTLCRDLIGYYADAVRYITRPQTCAEMNVYVRTTDCELESDNRLIDSYIGIFKNRLTDTLSFSVPVDASALLPEEEIAALWETVPTLTYTEPKPAPEPEPEPEQTTGQEDAPAAAGKTEQTSILSTLMNLFVRLFQRLKALFARTV